MTDLDRLNAEADGCHEWVLTRLADAAEEAGQETLAAGYRWLARMQRWPARKGDRWFWRAPERQGDEPDGPEVDSRTYGHGLPLPVLGRIKRRKLGLVVGRKPDEFASASEALRVAARHVGEWLATFKKECPGV